MKFNIGVTKGAAEAGQRLTAGIHKAKFMGVDRGTVEGKNGDTYDVVSLTLDVDGYGEYKQNFFVPANDEDEERTEGVYGPNPSKAEHFLIAMREIIAAVAPDAIEAIDKDQPVVIDDEEIKLGGSLTQFVNAMKKITNKHAGEEVEVKFIPQSNGFVSLPTFCARITRQGNLGIQTTFIGHDLTLSQREQRAIDNARNATPTNMASKEKGDKMLEDLRSDLKKDEGDDLPF